jgi:hypothetical protein
MLLLLLLLLLPVAVTASAHLPLLSCRTLQQLISSNKYLLEWLHGRESSRGVQHAL